VTLERRDVLVHRDAFMGFPPRMRRWNWRSTCEGLPMLNRSVRPRPVIRRGRLVEAVYQDGSLSISLKVETLEDVCWGRPFVCAIRNPAGTLWQGAK